MSISVNRRLMFFIREDVSSKYINTEKCEDFMESDQYYISMGDNTLEDGSVVDGVSSRILKFVNQDLKNGIISQEVKDDVLHALTENPSFKKARLTFGDLVNEIYNFDSFMGYGFSSPYQESLSRFKKDVDWYPNCKDMNFQEEDVIGSLYLGKPCLVKFNTSMKVFTEDMLKVEFERLTGKHYSTVSREQFYNELLKFGFHNYVSPIYYYLAKSADLLNDGVSLTKFNSAGKLKVILNWS